MTQTTVFIGDPLKAIWRHQSYQPFNFWYKWERERRKSGRIVFLSSRRIDIYAIWRTWVTTWPWPEVKFWPWPFKVTKYTLRCVLTRQKRWCQNHCSIISNTEAIIEKLFHSKMPFLTFLPRPAGGGAYSAPLSNIRDKLRTTQDITTKLSAPYRTSIWHLVWKFCQIWLENFWENYVLVTSCLAILS